jgi:DNA-binding MarR family transcriptional regulator
VNPAPDPAAPVVGQHATGEDPSAGVSAAELAQALVELSMQLDNIYRSVAKRLRLTAQQAAVLCMVEQAPPPMRGLAELLGCDTTNVTGLVDRVVSRQLAERVPNPGDRRVTLVALTAEGERVVAQFRAELQRSVSELLGAWPADRLGQLVALAGAAARDLRGARAGS